MDPRNFTPQNLYFRNLPQISNSAQLIGSARCAANSVDKAAGQYRNMVEETRTLLRERLEALWLEQKREIKSMSPLAARRDNAFPLAKIKRIMKTDENVKLVSVATPIVFSKASELFVSELILRAFLLSNNARRMICRADIARAISSSDIFDFLEEVVPEAKDLRIQFQLLQNHLLALENRLNLPAAFGPHQVPDIDHPSLSLVVSPDQAPDVNQTAPSPVVRTDQAPNN